MHRIHGAFGKMPDAFSGFVEQTLYAQAAGSADAHTMQRPRAAALALAVVLLTSGMAFALTHSVHLSLSPPYSSTPIPQATRAASHQAMLDMPRAINGPELPHLRAAQP